LERWQTFYPHVPPGPTDHGLGTLANIRELRIPPGECTPQHPWAEVEVLTYMYQGVLAHEDSAGGSGVLRAGEFQRLRAGRGVRQREANASRRDWAHLFQISLHSLQDG
jgi:redox-sensitive bicupin YhaK (pirin superfamily)